MGDMSGEYAGHAKTGMFSASRNCVQILGWCGYTWSAVVRPVECTAKFYEMPLETAYGGEMNIQFTGNSSGGHSCSQHANFTLPQNLQHLWHIILFSV